MSSPSGLNALHYAVLYMISDYEQFFPHIVHMVRIREYIYIVAVARYARPSQPRNDSCLVRAAGGILSVHFE